MSERPRQGPSKANPVGPGEAEPGKTRNQLEAGLRNWHRIGSGEGLLSGR